MRRRVYKDWETKNSRITQALRQLWLRSKERATALKRAKYTCNRCGVKQSVAKGKEVKVEVHHKTMRINWSDIADMIRQKLLPNPDELEVLCKCCHKKEHDNDSS
jgi:5-methylcytosine-specific restriction endonuclease McrA